LLGERDGVPEPSRELALTRGGRPVSAERKRLIDAFGGGYSAPATERYLNETLARLAPASQTPSEPYRVTILDSPVVNAFALPSGDIFVTRGLLALANDGSEVAAVMAHEIAHVTAHHAAQRAELEKTAALFTRVSSQVLDRPQEGARLRARRIGVVRRTHEQGHKVRPPRQTAEATPLEPG
jgi:predicted Zn-dependent protease